MLVRVVDEMDRPLPCRVLLRASDGRCHAPAGSVTLDMGRECWFMCSGRAKFKVPPGQVLLRVESVEEGVKMLDRLEAYARVNAAPEFLGCFLAAIDQARQNLSSRIQP